MFQTCLQQHKAHECPVSFENLLKNNDKFDKNVNLCPECFRFITKAEKCSHLYCANCEKSFCNLCIKEYQPGKQFKTNKNRPFEPIQS